MALNDFMNELQKSSFHHEPVIQTKIVRAVLTLMASQQKNEELRGIASIGLKTIVLEVHPVYGADVSNAILPNLLEVLKKDDTEYELQMDSLDVLSDILLRFGPQLSSKKQEEIQQTLLPLLSHSRAAVRKRATTGIGYLVVHANDQLFDTVLTHILSGLKTNKNSSEKLRTLVQSIGILGRYSAAKLGNHLSEIVPIVLEYTKQADEDDELREICLQTLESFVLRCPSDISKFIDEIINLGLEYLKYDPNYAQDDDDDDDVMDEDEDDEDDEYDDIADYSDDDDDMSWKVRRSATKLLTSVIETRSEILSQLYDTVSPALINKFNEREESVRIDILQAFIVLLRQTNPYKDDTAVITNDNNLEFDISGNGDDFALKAEKSEITVSMDIAEGPRQQLRSQVGKLCKVLSRQLSSKSIQTRQIGFNLLSEVITVLHGGLDNEISLFIPVIESSLSTSSADQQQSALSSNLKIDVLLFLRNFLCTHSPSASQPHLSQLGPVIINTISDRFYKITSEAFLVCIELIKAIRPIHQDKEKKNYDIPAIHQDYIIYIQNIYKATLKVLGTSDADQEVKERSIMCLGELLARSGDVLQPEQQQAWNILLERLQNEVTRLITVRVLAIISHSPVAAGKDLENFVIEAVNEIGLLLRKNNRSLRIASLECLTILVKRFGDKIPDESYLQLLNEIRSLITDSDLHLLPLALQLAESIINAHPSTVNSAKTNILPSLFQLIQSPLLQGIALKSLLNLFGALGRASPTDYDSFVKSLVDPLLGAHTSGVSAGGVAAVANKKAASTVAQCIAVLAANTDQTNCDTTVKNFQNYITDSTSNDSVRYLSLLSLGEIGKRVDLSSFNTLHEDIVHLFSAQSEEVKFAAAFALGNVTVGNISRYLPFVVNQFKEQPKRRFLLLHALKEVITQYDYQAPLATLQDTSDEIWTLLLESGESDQEEGTRSIVGECLGKLALTNPAKYLPQLETSLKSPSAQLRSTVATAFKYIVVDPSQSNDELLKPIIVQFLILLKDSDINVRRLALLTINSALHRKPYLIRDTLPSLLPLLYQETIVREELIHTVEMGPFKHRVDDGLEIRKAAYECLYTLLTTCLDKIDVHGYLECVRTGLDDQHDIKMLVYLMLVRLGKISPTNVAQKLDDLVAPLKQTLDFKIRSNAVKQELEKNQELVRATLRCIVGLEYLSESSISPKFEQFVEDIQNGPLSDEYKNTLVEAGKRESRVGDYMDLS
ncbi:unnamed protein product [Cunninghamella blakesleeana]